MPDGTYVGEDPDDNTIKRMRSFCVDVAIMKFGAMLGGEPVIEQARRMVYNTLGCKHNRAKIWTWNDKGKRTVEQVIALIERAAEKADASHPTGIEQEPLVIEYSSADNGVVPFAKMLEIISKAKMPALAA
ncbi:hypothetical protein C4585_02685 [Candidatus Parcubacteria bacterium]|nr:MAG: hypothetical protein C4585_02685 [Candidatus Parcubacteria bacterium]